MNVSINLKELVTAMAGLAPTAEEQAKQGTFKVVNIPKMTDLAKLAHVDALEQLDKMDAEVTINTDTGKATIELSSFHALYTGMVKVWPIAKPARQAIAQKRQEIVSELSDARKAVKDAEKEEARKQREKEKEVKDKERAEAKAKKEKEKADAKAKKEADAKAKKEAKERAERAKEEARAKAEKEKADAKAKADAAKERAAKEAVKAEKKNGKK